MRRARAVFTVAQNEPFFLPLWLAYYTKHFPAEDVYVLDHDSTDGSVEAAWRRYRPTVVRVHRDAAFDHPWLRDTAERFQRFLLQSYEQVLFAEADEFVVADPRRYPAGLADYVARNDRLFVRCAGLDVVQPPAAAPLDPALPVLAQGRRLVPSELYCKTLLARVPLSWDLGFHRLRRAEQPPVDPDLGLFHLRRVDRGLALDRNLERVTRTWAAEDLAAGRGWQSRLTDAAAFDRWFYDGLDRAVPIPDRFHGAI